jgi:hypothetical protein
MVISLGEMNLLIMKIMLGLESIRRMFVMVRYFRCPCCKREAEYKPVLLKVCGVCLVPMEIVSEEIREVVQ